MRSLTLAGMLALLLTATANAASGPSTDVEAARQAAIAAVSSDPLNFGGVYIERDGTLVIQYVGQNAGHAAVEAKLVPGVSARWEKVARNQLDLVGTAVAIRDLNLEGVNAIAVDTIGNQVKVIVGPTGSSADVRSYLLAVAQDGVLAE